MQVADRVRRGRQRMPRHSSLAGTNLERAADYNQRVTLQAVRVNGEITRLDLARITGLTPPSIANITNRLLQEGLILELGRLRGKRGQPAKRLAINPDGCFSIGLNIDRDHVTAVALDMTGNVRVRITDEVDFALPNAVVAFARKAMNEMLRSKQLARSRIIGTWASAPVGSGFVSRVVELFDQLVRIGQRLSIPGGELNLTATRSGGPGGQHANTADTRAEVRFFNRTLPCGAFGSTGSGKVPLT